MVNNKDCEAVSVLSGVGVGILVGMATGLHFFGVLKNSGPATAIGCIVGVGTFLTVGCATWLFIKAKMTD